MPVVRQKSNENLLHIFSLHKNTAQPLQANGLRAGLRAKRLQPAAAHVALRQLLIRRKTLTFSGENGDCGPRTPMG